MRSIGRIIVLAAAGMVIILLGSLVSAQSTGVTVFHGLVTLDGAAAPAGTTVEIVLEDGTLVGSGQTGAGALATNQYRIDVQATPSLESVTVQIRITGSATASPVTRQFRANRVFNVDIAAGVAPTPVPPTATPVPPTPTPRPTATPVPPTATPVPPTATPRPTATARPTATSVPPTATPRPTAATVATATAVPPTAVPTATPEESGGGGCSAGPGGGPLDVGWIALGLMIPGFGFFGWRRSRGRNRF